ncbi:hypothetical protein SPFM12_00260 [Salmonella phage SPFM12]|nr:hypothetical protein SPFM12_00260 [Salmonella phage SPFM12]
MISIAEDVKLNIARCIRFGSGLFSDLWPSGIPWTLMCGEDGCTQQELDTIDLADYWLVILGPLQAKLQFVTEATIDCAGNDLRTVLYGLMLSSSSGVYMRHMVEFADLCDFDMRLTLETATIGMQTNMVWLPATGIYVGFRAPHERDNMHTGALAALRRVRKSGIPAWEQRVMLPDGKASGAIAPRPPRLQDGVPAFAGALDRGDTFESPEQQQVYDDIYRALNMTDSLQKFLGNIKRSPKDGRLLRILTQSKMLIGLKQDPNIIAIDFGNTHLAETAEMGEDEAEAVKEMEDAAPKVPEQQQVREPAVEPAPQPKAPEAVAPAQPFSEQVHEHIHHTPEPVVEKAPTFVEEALPEPAPVQPVAQTARAEEVYHQHYHQPEPKLERDANPDAIIMAIKQANPDFSFQPAPVAAATQQEMILPTVPERHMSEIQDQRPGNARRPNPEKNSLKTPSSITTTL